MRDLDPGPRIVEWGLYLVAAVSSFWAVLWLLGTNGLGQIGLGDLPRWWEPLTLYGRNGQWTAKPAVPVVLERSDRVDLLSHYFALNGAPDQNGRVPEHWGEILPGASVVQIWDATKVQEVCYLLLQVAVFIAVALIAISIARLVAGSRGETPFTQRNVSRLRRIGALVLIGAPVASFANWACLHWMVESSSVGDRVRTYGYGVSSLPWWSMLVGAAVLVLADVWRRGVRMADDVAGLV